MIAKLALAASLSLVLAACNNQAEEGGSGTYTGDNLPANQGRGGTVGDNAPGGSAEPPAQTATDTSDNPAGAQAYPATGVP